MFHSNAPSSFGASITRTQGRSVIHNDENAMAMPLLSSKNMIMHMHMNLHLHLRNKPKSGTRSGALRTHNSNSNVNSNVNANSNSKPSFANMNAKTPLKNRNSTNTRRRALGDISNRKGTANGNANGNGFGGIHMNIHADAKSNTCSENSKETHVQHVPVSIYTPHKRSEKKRSSNININTNGLKQNTSMNTFPSSTTHTRTRTGKKKHISFAIHTSSELTPNDHTCGSRATRTRTRTPPEREILGNNTNRGCFSIDVDEGLDAIRAIHEQDRYNAMNNLKHHIMSEDELGHHAVQEALSHLEHVDDDVLQSHLMFDEYNDLFGGSLDDNEDEDDLIANSDDISI